MTTNAAIHIEAGPPRRRLILALGRGKSGKTIWARWLTEVMRARGVNPVVADADTVGTGLCRYEEGALRPVADDGANSRGGMRSSRIAKTAAAVLSWSTSVSIRD